MKKSGIEEEMGKEAFTTRKGVNGNPGRDSTYRGEVLEAAGKVSSLE